MARLTQEKQKQIVTVAIVGALALAAIWWFGIRHLQQRLVKLNASITATQDKKQEADRLVLQAPQRQADLDDALRRLDELETKMVSGDTNN